jgi:hypothetical protein
VIAAILYFVLFKALKPRLGPPVAETSAQQAKLVQ